MIHTGSILRTIGTQTRRAKQNFISPTPVLGRLFGAADFTLGRIEHLLQTQVVDLR